MLSIGSIRKRILWYESTLIRSTDPTGRCPYTSGGSLLMRRTYNPMRLTISCLRRPTISSLMSWSCARLWVAMYNVRSRWGCWVLGEPGYGIWGSGVGLWWIAWGCVWATVVWNVSLWVADGGRQCRHTWLERTIKHYCHHRQIFNLIVLMLHCFICLVMYYWKIVFNQTFNVFKFFFLKTNCVEWLNDIFIRWIYKL